MLIHKQIRKYLNQTKILQLKISQRERDIKMVKKVHSQGNFQQVTILVRNIEIRLLDSQITISKQVSMMDL